MTEFEVPSNSFNSIGCTETTGRLLDCTNLGSTKQWVDPESTRAEIRETESGIADDVNDTRREFGSERADALSRTTSEQAQEGSAQSSACAEA